MMPWLMCGQFGQRNRAFTPTVYSAETQAWYNGIAAAGGSTTTQEKDWADALILAIQGATYGSKIKYLLPFLGANIIAARMPLRDTLAAGIAANTSFVDADVGNAVGITNPTEASKILNTGIRPELVNSQNIGLGWYERNWGAGSGVEPIGCYDSTFGGAVRCAIDLRASSQAFRMGANANSPSVASTASSAHYYGQRSGATSRELFKNGSSIATNTTSDAGFATQSRTIRVMGNVDHGGGLTYWKGRGACAYITDGTMSSGDVSAFHTLLGSYLITPTGR